MTIIIKILLHNGTKKDTEQDMVNEEIVEPAACDGARGESTRRCVQYSFSFKKWVSFLFLR
jgi:hypothetical protein